MKFEIINIPNYLLIVSKQTINESDWFIYKNVVNQFNGFDEDAEYSNVLKEVLNDSYKIIAHLPLNGNLKLSGVDLLPALKIEKHDTKSYTEFCQSNPQDKVIVKHFLGGYNKAKELYKYTEQDIEKIINLAYVSAGAGDSYENCRKFVLEQINTNDIKIPLAFEADYKETGLPVSIPEEGINYYTNENSLYVPYEIIKNNNVWSGKYLYE